MFENLVGQMFKKSERAPADQFHASGKSINEKVRLYARVGQALIQARASGGDAIESVLPWSEFESTVAEAQKLAQPEEFDYLALLDDRYSTVRKFAPPLLAHFEFHAAPAAAKLALSRDKRRITPLQCQVLFDQRCNRIVVLTLTFVALTCELSLRLV